MVVTMGIDVHQLTRCALAVDEAGRQVGSPVTVRVPPKPMAQTHTRTRGKSDPIDALAIAWAALREPDLPRAEHTRASRELHLLVDRDHGGATRPRATPRAHRVPPASANRPDRRGTPAAGGLTEEQLVSAPSRSALGSAA